MNPALGIHILDLRNYKTDSDENCFRISASNFTEETQFDIVCTVHRIATCI